MHKIYKNFTQGYDPTTPARGLRPKNFPDVIMHIPVIPVVYLFIYYEVMAADDEKQGQENNLATLRLIPAVIFS